MPVIEARNLSGVVVEHPCRRSQPAQQLIVIWVLFRHGIASHAHGEGRQGASAIEDVGRGVGVVPLQFGRGQMPGRRFMNQRTGLGGVGKPYPFKLDQGQGAITC